MSRLGGLPESVWSTAKAVIKGRTYPNPSVVGERVAIRGYLGKIRQVAAMDLGKARPMLHLKKDAREKPETLLTRYARRTLIENGLGGRVESFHVDVLSSSVRIQGGLDIALSVVGSAVYRWIGPQLQGTRGRGPVGCGRRSWTDRGGSK